MNTMDAIKYVIDMFDMGEHEFSKKIRLVVDVEEIISLKYTELADLSGTNLDPE